MNNLGEKPVQLFERTFGLKIDSVKEDKSIGYFSFTSKTLYPYNGKSLDFIDIEAFLVWLDDLKREIIAIEGKWSLLTIYDSHKIYIAITVDTERVSSGRLSLYNRR